MDQLKQQVECANRRLLVQAWLRSLPWSLSIGLACAALVIGIDKFLPLGIEPWAWLVAGLAVGLVGVSGWTLWRRRGRLDAAIEIDRRYGLKERVSTAFSLPPEQLETSAGQALLKDAQRRVAELNLSDRFQVSLNRWSLLPLLPAAIAIVLILFVPAWTRQQQLAAGVTPVQVKKQVRTSMQQLDKKLAEKSAEAKKEGLQDAEELLKKLELATKQNLNKPGELDKKQALVKLNDLSKELEQRRNKLVGNESLKQQLNDLKDLDKGPADKLAQALKDGKLQDALKELEHLKRQIAEGKLDEAAKQQLAKQMEQMQQKLAEMAQAHQDAQEKLKQQIAEKQASGKQDETDELQRQLDKLAQQNPRQQQVQKLAQKLGQCAQCMKQGNAQDAAQQLAEMQTDLESLNQQLAEADLLDEAMQEIGAAKDSMNCKKCGGAGCAQCQGNQQGRPGQGLGRGRGEGQRPEEKGRTSAYDSAVRQKVGKGSGIVVDEVAGPNVRGNVEQEIATQFEHARTEAADPLTGQRLPKASQNQAKEYFDALREGRK